MAVTLEQMASQYIENLKIEISRAEEELKKHQEYVANLTNHLQECVQEVESKTAAPEITTTTTAVPNPFANMVVSSDANVSVEDQK